MRSIQHVFEHGYSIKFVEIRALELNTCILLYDTVPLVVYTDQLLCQYIFIYSNFHWQLVSLFRDDSLYCYCLLAGSYETINQPINRRCFIEAFCISIDSLSLRKKGCIFDENNDFFHSMSCLTFYCLIFSSLPFFCFFFYFLFVNQYCCVLGSFFFGRSHSVMVISTWILKAFALRMLYLWYITMLTCSNNLLF